MWRRVPRARDAHRQGRRTPPPHVTPSPLPASLLGSPQPPLLVTTRHPRFPSRSIASVSRTTTPASSALLRQAASTCGSAFAHRPARRRAAAGPGRTAPDSAEGHPIQIPATSSEPDGRVTPGIHVRVGTPIPIRIRRRRHTPRPARNASRSMTGPMPAPGGSRTSNTTGSSNPGRSPGSVRSRIRTHDCRLPLCTRHGIAAWSHPE